MVVGVNMVFDCDRLGKLLGLGSNKAYRVSSEICPDRGGLISMRKREVGRRRGFLRKKGKKKEEEIKVGQGFRRTLFRQRQWP